MTISFQLPPEIEKSLRRDVVDLDEVAKQALAIEAVRSGKLSLGQFAKVLGLSTYEADGVLKQRGVLLDLSDAEAQQERDTLRRFTTE